MKKKVVIFLTAMLVSMGILSGCSDKEPVNSAEPVYVKEIDDETLKSQVKIFMEHRNDWTVQSDEAKNYDSVAYALNDLNHNGRSELVIACWVGSSDSQDLKVYEINEEGDGYSKLDVDGMTHFPENYWEGFYYTENKTARSRTAVEDLENGALEGILTDSYKVFAGKLGSEVFYERYIALNDPDRSCEDMLREAVGNWGLCRSDTEGDVTYYEPGDPFYKTLAVSEDRTMILTEEESAGSEYVIKVNLMDHADGMLFGYYEPNAKDGQIYDSLLLAIVDLDEEGRLVVTMDCWSGKEYLTGSSWYFKRIE